LEAENKAITKLHMFLCFGVLTIIILLHLAIRPISFEGLDQNIDSISMFALFTAVLAIVLSNYLFTTKAKKLGPAITSENHLEYRRLYIMKWSFLDGACLINVMIYFFYTNHPALIIVALLLLLLLYVSKPKMNI